MVHLYTVDSNRLFEAKFCKPRQNVDLNRKNDNALINQAQVPKKGSVGSVITNAKVGLRKWKSSFQRN